MRQPPTAFQKMRYRREQREHLAKRKELPRLAHQVAAQQRQANPHESGSQLRDVNDA
ncbi:hypothetical protein [Hydrogenophaga defluvii]|uniref:Transposase n=1 Tax=Hydrogenophaga defluvii TaxID=249410 RepID=A0ABW2SC77_9BURK